MDQNTLYELVSSLNRDYIGPLLTIVLLGAGIFFTIRLHFIPRFYLRTLRHLFKSSSIGHKASKQHGMSPFQALSTAIASQVGTGNIVGVAMALVMGGPGAVFWLWISAVLGMSTNFAEAVLGQLFRTKTPDGHIIGGPAYYIQNGLHSKFMARLFAVFFIIALGMIGIMVQANSISDALVTLLPSGVKSIYVGIVLTIFVGFVLSGGISTIASFVERVVPVMAGIFILGSLVFICIHIDTLIPQLSSIFKCAFTTQAGVGGAVGVSVKSAIRYGISRGLFSNEAGLGTTPHAHAIAKVNEPYEQGLYAIVGISVDILICTLTSMVILMSGVLQTSSGVMGIRHSECLQSSHLRISVLHRFVAQLSHCLAACHVLVPHSACFPDLHPVMLHVVRKDDSLANLSVEVDLEYFFVLGLPPLVDAVARIHVTVHQICLHRLPSLFSACEQ